MINAKVKIFKEDYPHNLEQKINEFLETIDIRQVIKTDFSTISVERIPYHYFTAIIYYIELEDVRDAKIENLLDNKNI